MAAYSVKFEKNLDIQGMIVWCRVIVLLSVCTVLEYVVLIVPPLSYTANALLDSSIHFITGTG